MEELHDTELNGKKLFVARAQKRSERDEELRRSHEASRIEQESKTQGVNLYIKNIDGECGVRAARVQSADWKAPHSDEWDDERLRAEFDAFGTITSCKIMRDEKTVASKVGSRDVFDTLTCHRANAPLPGLRFRLLHLPRRGHQGCRRDERQDDRHQTPLRRHRSTQGNPSSSSREPDRRKERSQDANGRRRWYGWTCGLHVPTANVLPTSSRCLPRWSWWTDDGLPSCWYDARSTSIWSSADRPNGWYDAIRHASWRSIRRCHGPSLPRCWSASSGCWCSTRCRPPCWWTQRYATNGCSNQRSSSSYRRWSCSRIPCRRSSTRSRRRWCSPQVDRSHFGSCPTRGGEADVG